MAYIHIYIYMCVRTYTYVHIHMNIYEFIYIPCSCPPRAISRAQSAIARMFVCICTYLGISSSAATVVSVFAPLAQHALVNWSVC